MATTASYTFTVPYVQSTDNLVTQSNLLLNQILGKILEENSNLSILHTYVYGSEEFEGYPIWNTPVSSTPIGNTVYNKPTYTSDIILIGKDNSKYCMVAFIVKNGTALELKIGLACGTDTDTIMQNYYTNNNITKNLYAPSSFFVRARSNTWQYYLHISIPILNNAYTVFMDTYSGTYSKGYHLRSDTWNWIQYGYSIQITSDELIIFQSAGNTVVSSGNTQRCPTIINLNEDVCTNPLRLVIQPGDASTIEDGSKVNLDNWGYPGLSNNDYNKSGMVYPAHTLLISCYINGQGYAPVPNSINHSVITSDTWIIPFTSIYQLPKLKVGQVFIRKMFIPNSAIKTDNIVLLYTPLDAVTNKMLFSANGHTYLSRMPSQLSIAVRVD